MRQSIPALYGGVSQQAASIRASNQCEEAINCQFTIAEGVGKRPGLFGAANLIGGADDVRFSVMVTAPNGVGYMVVIGEGTYEVYRLSDGAKCVKEESVHTDFLAPDLPDDGNPPYRAAMIGNLLYVARRDLVPALLDDIVEGSVSGDAQTLQDTALDSAINGAIYRILGSDTTTFDTYYVKKVNNKWVEWHKPGTKYKINPDTMPYVIEFTVNSADVGGLKTYLRPGEWTDLLVGDDKSNKPPSFIGRKITSVFTAHDRLGVLSEDFVSMSETGKHGNFYRTTVTDVLDSDRIDVRVAQGDPGHLLHAAPLSNSLVLFAQKAQLSMDGRGVFGPKTVSVTTATTYPSSALCEPVAMGSNLYFPVVSGTYTTVREMFVQRDAVVKDAADVSSHVPEYIGGRVNKMAACTNLDMLFIHDANLPGQLKVYKTHYSGDEKVQSAWSTWTFPVGMKVLSMGVVNDVLYIYFNAGNEGAHLGKIALKKQIGLGLTTPVALDYATEVEPLFNAVENRTYFTSTMPIMRSEYRPFVEVVFASGYTNAGAMIRQAAGSPTFFPVNDYTFYLVGNWTGTDNTGTAYVGLEYSQRFTFSEFFYSSDRNAALNARLQIRNLAISFVGTAYFNVEVKMRGKDLVSSPIVPQLLTTFTARTVGDEYFKLNRPQLSNGSFRSPILSRSSDVTITLVNDSYLPANFVNAEWEGLVTTRTRG